MPDQIFVKIERPEVDERTALPVSAQFRQESDASASSPTTVHYRVYNLDTREVIKDWTAIAAAASVSFTIPSSALKIRNESNIIERYGLLVAADKGTDDQLLQEKTIRVRNIRSFREDLD